MEKNNIIEDLVSFCIPCFNAAKFIRLTIDSIILQTYNKIEVIIVDDSSTDNSWNILESFTDNRIKIFKANFKGAAAARNQAFNESKGEFIIFFDADDWIPNNFVSSQLKCLAKNKNDVCITKWGRFYGDDFTTYKEDTSLIKRDLTFKEWIAYYWRHVAHMTQPGRILIPRVIIDKAGLWDEELTLNDDFYFFTKIFSHCNKIIYNDNSSLYYRSGVGGLSTKVFQFSYQQSNYKSLANGIDIALTRFPKDSAVEIACANMIQNFIYENYPNHKPLLKLANKRLLILPKPDFKFPAGGLTEKMVNIFGWKLVKRIKKLIVAQN